MGDVITRLGVDYQDAGSKAFIADAQVMAKESTNLVESTKMVAASTSEIDARWANVTATTNTLSAATERAANQELQLAQAQARGASAAGDYATAIQILRDALEGSQASTLAQVNADNQLGAAQRDLIASTEASADSHARFGGTIGTTSGVMREGRLLIAAMTAEMALMSLTAGETLPASLREAAKGLQEVTTFAMMGFIAAGPLGAVIGGLAGGFLALATAAMSASPEVQALTKQLDDLATKTQLGSTLSTLTGLTEAEGDAALAAAPKNEALAVALDDLVKERTFDTSWQASFFDFINKLSEGLPLVGGWAAAQDELNRKWHEGKEATDQATIALTLYMQQYEQLNNTLAKNAIGTNATELVKLSGITQQNATDVLKYAQTHETFNKDLQDTVKMLEYEKAALETGAVATSGADIAIQNLTQHLRDLVAEMILAQERAAQPITITIPLISASAGIEEAQHKMALLAQDTTIKLEEFAAQEVTDREQAEAQKVRAAQNADQQIARLAQSLADELASIDQQRVNASEQNADQVARANRSLNEALARDAQQLSDRLADINQSLADKEADAWRQYQDKLRTLGDDLVRQRQDLADKIRDIDRKLAEDLAAFDFRTGEEIRSAKTEHDRADIERRAVFERAQIEQRASDEKSTAERRFAEEQALTEEKKRLAREEYEYRISLAEREAAQQRAHAERTYAEQVAQAQQRNRDELADLQERLNDENRRLDQQAARARERNAQEVANVQARLKTEIADIETRYQAEIRAIEVARDAFLRAEREKEAALNVTIAQLQYQILLLTNAAMVFEQENPEVRRGGGVVPTHQLGGMVEGPLGAPKLVMAHGGEEIIPVGARGTTTKESTPQWVNISAEPLVAPVVEKMIAQMFQSGLFREGVRVAINDGMFQ